MFLYLNVTQSAVFLYHLKNDNYEPINQSELLPDLDIDLLVNCVLTPSIIDGRTEFIKGLKK